MSNPWLLKLSISNCRMSLRGAGELLRLESGNTAIRGFFAMAAESLSRRIEGSVGEAQPERQMRTVKRRRAALPEKFVEKLIYSRPGNNVHRLAA